MTGDELRRARRRLRLTQHDLGMRLGRHRNAIRAYEQGREPIPPAIAYATAWLLLHGDADPFAGHEAPADDIAAE